MQQQPKTKDIPRKLLSVEEVFNPRGNPRLAVLRNHMKSEGRLSEACALKIIRSASALFGEEPNLLEIEAPVTICGIF